MKDVCNEKHAVKLEEEVVLDAKNGDSSLISKAMTEVEEKLLEERVKEEEGVNGVDKAPHLNDTQFTKLDELLTQTQLYSEFLLEKMDDITAVSSYISFLMYLLLILNLSWCLSLIAKIDLERVGRRQKTC